MTRKRLVLLVEGDGDVQAAPQLLKRILAPEDFSHVILDPHPFRVGGFPDIIKGDCANWKRYLAAANKRRNLGACLLMLDGDWRHGFDRETFCASRAAGTLALQAREVGAGSSFSVAVVFACQEFESWSIAGGSSLAGKSFSDGRKELPESLPTQEGDLEIAPRDAKGWFRTQMRSGYKPTRDQAELTRLVDLNVIRERQMRSFQRLEHSIQQLVAAIRSEHHIVSPDPTAKD